MAEPTAPQRLNVTMDDVAHRAGVSRATVSRVLVGHPPVSEATRERVETAISELGYVPNQLAQQLARRSSDVVGLLLRDPRNPAYGSLHAFAQSEASQRGLQLVATIPHWEAPGEAESAALRALLGLRVGGLLVATGVIAARELAPFVDTVPVVVVGRVENDPRLHAVSYAEERHGVMLADLVVEHGHRDVLVVAPVTELSMAEHVRGRSIVARLRAHGCRVQLLEPRTLGDAPDMVPEAVEVVRRRDASVVMFSSDRRALQFLRAAEAAGLRVPQDVSVTGCDGINPALDLLGLSTLLLPVETVTRRAVAHLAEMLGRPGAPVLHEQHEGTIVVGRTLGAVS